MAEYPTLVPDTFHELRAERRRHLDTLIQLERWQARSGLPTANGTMAADRCRLCDEPPAGISTVLFRSLCPCRDVAAHLATQRARLAVEITNGKKPPAVTSAPGLNRLRVDAPTMDAPTSAGRPSPVSDPVSDG